MHIAIIYNLTDELLRGTDQDRAGDSEIEEVAGAIQAALVANGHGVATHNVYHNGVEALDQYDAIFNLAESTLSSDLAEDVIAEKLEHMGIVFTGSGSTALRKCADKAWTKAMLISQGIPTPRYQLFRTPDNIETELLYPLIVKPVHEDGSIGITDDSVVGDADHLERKVLEVLRVYREPALVEEFVDGREINVAIIGNGAGARVLPLSEILFTLKPGKPRIVSRDAKWREDSQAYKNTNNRCPAQLDPFTEAAVKDVALRAYRIMGCADYARVDMRLSGDRPFVLEVNPNPWLNPAGAGFVVSAKAAGLSFQDVVGEILGCALARRVPASERLAIEPEEEVVDGLSVE